MKLFHMSFLNALRSIGAIHRIYLGKSHAKGISIGIGTRMGARILSLSLGFSKLKSRGLEDTGCTRKIDLRTST